MRKREQPDKVRDALIVVGGAIIGVAMLVEIKFIMPHDPIAAAFIVIGAGLLASACTLTFLRQ